MASHSGAEKVLQNTATRLGEQPRKRVHVLQIGRHTRLGHVCPLGANDRGRTLFRLDQRHHLLEPNYGLVAESCVDHVRADGGELHPIDSVAQQLLLERLHLATHCVFGATIRHEVLESNHASHRTERHNMAAVLVGHVFAKGLHRPQMSVHVDLEHLPDLRFGLTVQRLAGHNSGIVDQDRDEAHLRLYLLVQLEYLLATGDVATEGEGEEQERRDNVSIYIVCN